MSEVKRFDVPSMRSLTQGEQAVMGYEVVLAYDYDALAAEAQALREEVSALRARVVVTPALRDVSASVDPEYRASATGYNLACADMESLNGLTVSEGLLREVARHLGNWLELHECECDGGFHYCGRDQVAKTNRELRALLNQDKENGNG